MSMDTKAQLQQTRDRMGDLFTPNQVLGRIHTIGCVAVEITQRCNLDCTLCYLSEHSQQVKDIPLSEVFRRLDQALEHYGPGTPVQITGGDPTLRKHKELVQIVRYAADLGLYPAMFTNGIAASRPLLERLAAAGLKDVAFHVDTTQRREEYADELALNAVRSEYIERARGLGLMVIFNTTVHSGNFHHLPQLTQFFIDNADVVGLASFQLQAETGRGEWGSRDVCVSHESVKAQLDAAMGAALPWGVIQVGHHDCHSYMPTVVSNRKAFPLALDRKLFSDFLEDFQSLAWDRQKHGAFLGLIFLWELLKRPAWWLRAAKYVGNQGRRMGGAILRDRGRVRKLTFFVQNFMDANHLEQDRIDGCSFMVMTADGPVSMCKHNANRDEHILKPLEIKNEDGSVEVFEPLKWVSDTKRAKG